MAVLFGEIGGFGVDGLENSLDLLSRRSISNGSVERLRRELKVHEHALMPRDQLFRGHRKKA